MFSSVLQGGFGSVFDVWDPHTEFRYAMKVVPKKLIKPHQVSLNAEKKRSRIFLVTICL